MATVLTRPATIVADMAVVLPGIGWADFERIVQMKSGHRCPRLIYHEGNLTLMSPSLPHESGVDRLDLIVKEICIGLRIPCKPTGSTLFRRPDLDKGIEGDRTYYLAHEEAVRGKKEIDLEVDPPPDLAIEVQVAHPARDAVEIWRRLGVPEVWVFDPLVPRLAILQLDAEGRHVEAEASRLLPTLAATDILAWLLRPEDEPESYWGMRLREWVRDVLAKRAAK